MKEVDPRFMRSCEVLLALTDFEVSMIPARASAKGFDEVEVANLLASIDRNDGSPIHLIRQLRAWCDRYM